MRELDSPPAAPDAERVTMEQAGREFCQRLELKGRGKSHRLTVASGLRNHIAPFFAGKTLDRIRAVDIERYVSAKRRTLAVKTIRNHVRRAAVALRELRDRPVYSRDRDLAQHHALDLRSRASQGLVLVESGQAR